MSINTGSKDTYRSRHHRPAKWRNGLNPTVGQLQINLPRAALKVFLTLLMAGFTVFGANRFSSVSPAQSPNGASRSVPGFAPASAGLRAQRFQTPHGAITVNFPADIAAGDLISGLVTFEPAGQTRREKRKNLDELDGLVFEIEKGRISLIRRVLKWSVPPTSVGPAVGMIVRDRRGRKLARTEVPILPAVPKRTFGALPNSSGVRSPGFAQAGRPAQIPGSFDGDLTNTDLRIGGVERRILAESPRTVVFRATEERIGAIDFEVVEGNEFIRGRFWNIRVQLVAAKTELIRGETTLLTARVEGLPGSSRESFPVLLQIVNQSPRSVAFDGVGGNVFSHLIEPGESTGDGTYIRTLGLRGKAPGRFRIIASVTPLLPTRDPSSGERRLPGLANRQEEPVGKVDIDVDWNRNGQVEDDRDDAKEAEQVGFLKENGALVLVNCDSDIGKKGDMYRRDMDDFIVSNADDQKDMSPLSLELGSDLRRGEELWLVIKSADGDGRVWANVMDPLWGGNKNHTLVSDHQKELRLDDLVTAKGERLFPGGKKKRYDGRFLIEGLRFAMQVEIILEIRSKDAKPVRDRVRVLVTPWLANNNSQPLADEVAWKIPGNMVNSASYVFKAKHDAKLFSAGQALEFVQDSVEWGYQVRRQKPHEKSRTMITALRLYSDREDLHPMKRFLNDRVGVYGYFKGDEEYFEKKWAGDQGGNLECLPPSKGYPFGRIVYGDTMSAKLRKFLSRQKAQFGKGAVELGISKIRLAHVDEMISIVPTKDGYFVAMPDWALGKKLLKDAFNRSFQHHVPVVDENSQNLETYGKILRYLVRSDKGKERDKLYDETIEGLQKRVRDAGAKVVEIPGLFLITTGGMTGPQVQRAFPRNPANSQPTIAGKLILSRPPLQTKGKGKARESFFLRRWKKILKAQGVVAKTENMSLGWRKGGEVHCSSNAIREPLRR